MNTNDKKSAMETQVNMEKRTTVSLSSWLRLGEMPACANIANNYKEPLWQGGEMLWKDLNLCQTEPYEMADIQPFSP